jgi:hypothetical protein
MSVKIKNIMANSEGSNAKLDGLVQWSPAVPGDETMQKSRKSCKDAGCRFLTERHGGKAGLYEVMDGPRKGAFVTKKEASVIVRRASEKISELRSTKTGETLRRVPQCFAWYGPIFHGFVSKHRAHNRGKDYTLETSLKDLKRSHKYARGAVIGNASTFYTPEEMKVIDEQVRSTGVGHIMYDHAWAAQPWILGYACASANNVDEIPKALSLGAAVVTVALPKDEAHAFVKEYEGPAKPVVCPESRGKMNCNDCGLCDAVERRQKMDKGQKPLVVVFYEHASGSHKRTDMTRQNNMRKWLDKSAREWGQMTPEEKRAALLDLYIKAKKDKRSRKEGRTLPRHKAVAGAFFWLFREDIE